MAKVKKMAFGGPSFAGPKPPGMTAPKPGMGIPNYAQSASQQGGPKQLPAPPGAIFPQPNVRALQNAPETQSRLIQNARSLPQDQRADFAKSQQMAQLRGAMGGNQAPAGNNLLRAYAQNTLKPGSGIQSLDPNVDKAMQSYQGQAGQGAGVPDYAKPYISQAGQGATPNPFQSMAGMGAGMAGAMKKGGAVKAKVKAKAYAKGGKVSSASSRGDGIAARGKTKGRII